MSIAINPETKVGALLDAYPNLEAVLISMAPAFEKLRNPILRKTVAKIATLEQASRIGGVTVQDLVRQLRHAVGQPWTPDIGIAEIRNQVPGPEPAWIAGSTVGSDIDGDLMLEQGLHPLGKVRESVAALSTGEMVRLSTSFRPEPLIEALRKSGVDTYSKQESASRFLTYFRRPA